MKLAIAILLAVILVVTGIGLAYFQTSESTLALGDHVLDGDTVYIDDTNVYLAATPHTIGSSGWVTFNLIPKLYTGNIDVAWGFDASSGVKLSQPQKWDGTAWNTWEADFSSTNFDLGPVDKWYYLTNLSVTAASNYSVRCWVDIPFKGNVTVEGEYLFAIKPSGETISEAHSNNHLYVLDPWYNASWDYRIKLTVDESKLDDGNDLTHFPVLVALDSGNMDFSPTQADGDDIRFTQDDGETLLDYEFELWDKGGEEAWIWVSDSAWTIDSETDTDFYMYYGNDEASSGENITGVWNSGYVMVQHMNSASNDADGLVDSTSNNNDSSVNTLDTTAGQIGLGMNANGAEYGSIPNAGSLWTPVFTISAWVNMVDATSFHILSKGQSTSSNLQYYYGGNGGDDLAILVYDQSKSDGARITADVASTADQGTWVQYIVTYDGTDADGLNLYRNGEPWAATRVTDPLFVAMENHAIAVRINRYRDVYAEGDTDEVRLSNVERSAAWVKGTYHSGNNDLLVYGSVVQQCAPTLDTLPAASVEETAATLWGNLTDYCYNTITERGFVWGTSSQSPGNTTSPGDSSYDSSWTETAGGGLRWPEDTFSRGITGLSYGELYYNRACANSTTEYWGYGDEETFLTKPSEPENLAAVDGSGESIDLTWDKGTGAQNTEIWGQTGSYPTYGEGTLTYNNTGTNYNDTNPSAGEAWYYTSWSYATEGGLSQYSDNHWQANALCIGLSSVTTLNATAVEETTATLNGNVTDTGGENNDDQGFEWDTDSGTPYESSQTWGGNYGSGPFNDNLLGLTKGELYYYRGMSHNTEGWAYGEEVAFLTRPDPPNAFACGVSTTNSSAYLIWSSGTGRDTTLIRYATGSYPTDESSGTLAYNGTGTLCIVTSLNASTTYYFRAWSWATEGALQQYSGTTANCTETTTGAPTPGETSCGGTGVIAIIIIAGIATALPMAVSVLPLFIVAALAWAGTGIYFLSTSDVTTSCWLFGWICLLFGLFCIFEFIRRTASLKSRRPTDDDEANVYRKRIDRVLGRG